MTTEERVEKLLAQMTPAEKAGQLTQYFYFRLPEGAQPELDFDPDEQPQSSQVWLDQLDAAQALPHSPTWNEAEGFADDVLTQLFAGELTIDEAIAQIEEGTARELEEG